MVRAAGQGHGRNDAATTDPQPRARCSSHAHDAMSVTRDSGSSSTRMFSSLLGSRTPHEGVFSIRIFSLLRGLWMFVLVRVVGAIETESSGETAGNQAVRQVSGPSRRPSGTSLGVAGRTEINCRFSKFCGEHLAQRNQLVQQGKVTGCVQLRGWA